MDHYPQGVVLFSSVGVADFAFDVFSVSVSDPTHEIRHTDGVSLNFNAQFAEGCDDEVVSFVSERTGSARIYLARPGGEVQQLPGFAGSLFHDRPIVRNGRVYFVSAHEKPSGGWFRSWAALYTAPIGDKSEPVRLTPAGTADMSPAVSASGNFVAVATYGSRRWEGDFRELDTEIVVFPVADPSRRRVVAGKGSGSPTWLGDDTLFFHRKAEDGWWSVYRCDIFAGEGGVVDDAVRVTPPGVHALTPAVAQNGKWVAVATRRKDQSHRHIEIFDLATEKFRKITEIANPILHHYCPFFSSDSSRLGYHRFRGGSDSPVTPYLQRVASPVGCPSLTMIRVHGNFPSLSPDGEFIAVNGDFTMDPAIMVMKSDGSKRFVLLKEPPAFFTAWSPTEPGVVFTSIGPIFESSKTTVQIARISFNPADLRGGDGEDKEIHADVRILTRSDKGNNAFSSCSPDGRWLVFRSGRSGHKNLYVVDAVNGESESGAGIRRLTEGEWTDTMPSWSPDGELIAFSSNRHDPTSPTGFSIYLLKPDGSGLRRVHVAGKEGSTEVSMERINHVCFSPDSQWLLFSANLGGVMAEPIAAPNQFQPYGDLYACRLDGTGLVRLTCNAYEDGTATWHGSGTALDLVGLSLRPPPGIKLHGKIDEPLWLTCDDL